MSKLTFITGQKPSQTAQDLHASQFVQNLRQQVDGNKLVTPALGKSMVSLESLDDAAVQGLNRAGEQLTTALESITGQLFGDYKHTDAQVMAAVSAGLSAGDWRAHLSRATNVTQVSTESVQVIGSVGTQGALEKRSFGLEAYDERNNSNAVVYAIAYNYQASRQDEFGETLFPTITLTNENVGFGITVNLMMVYDAVERQISGAVTEFNKKNIIRAIADPTILRRDSTKVVPVHRTESASQFSTVVGASAVMLEGESINTAPLAFGKVVDLIGISQTAALLASGVMNQSDSLDPAITLSNVYVTVGNDDVLRLPTLNLAYANFIAAPQDNYRISNLNFRNSGLMLNKNSVNADGSALTDLASIVTNDLVVHLELAVTGQANIETGKTEVYGNRIAVTKIFNASGQELDLTAAPAAAIVALFASAKLDSYDLLAYRTNMNRRQLGQLIDVTKFTQLYNVPLRAPITAQHPINTDGSTDASDVQALIATTRVRMSNDAVAALIGVSETLSQILDPRVKMDVGQALTAIGRWYVIPTFMQESIDMATAIDSIKSHERAADIQAVLVNHVRDMAYRMYRDSEYKAAADALSGGISKVPTVIVATDPVIARYINVEGDLRTLSGGFDIKIVSTLDKRVEGKIFVTFGVFDETRNVAPNPLNFGNMIWAPEMVLSANISRSGTSRETVVQPRYLFTNHLPILGVIQVSNIPAVLNSVPIEFKNVP
jgi:hypothetical protein